MSSGRRGEGGGAVFGGWIKRARRYCGLYATRAPTSAPHGARAVCLRPYEVLDLSDLKRSILPLEGKLKGSTTPPPLRSPSPPALQPPRVSPVRRSPSSLSSPAHPTPFPLVPFPPAEQHVQQAQTESRTAEAAGAASPSPARRRERLNLALRSEGGGGRR